MAVIGWQYNIFLRSSSSHLIGPSAGFIIKGRNPRISFFKKLQNTGWVEFCIDTDQADAFCTVTEQLTALGFAFHDANMTWEAASQQCVLAKYDFGQFYSDSLIRLCSSFRMGYTHTEAWIGLRVQKAWKWLDGSDINDIITTNTTIGRGCLAVEKTVYEALILSRHNCSLMLPFVCEKASLPATKTCDETSIMAAVAQQHVITHPRAGQCSDGTSDRAEALLLAFCDAKMTTMWRPGIKVLDNCSTLPLHSPVATFQLGYYVQNDNGLAGIFLGCSGNGFSMAVQMCGQPPRIVFLTSVQSNGFAGNADNYHAVTYNVYSGTPIIG